MSEVRRWTDISENPNSPEVLAWRGQRLKAAWRDPVRDRIAYLLSLVQGKAVLDVGPVAHSADRHDKGDWLHKHVAGAADQCLGVDILKRGAQRLQQAGYNIRVCDVLNPEDRRNLEGGYEIMMCGELIEHLDHPGALFEAARDLLAPDGRLVLTTPNPFYLWNVGRHLLMRPNDSVDHVTFLFPSGIAELAERHGLILDSFRGTLIPNLTWKHYTAFRIGTMLRAVLSPDVFCIRMIYEIIRPN